MARRRRPGLSFRSPVGGPAGDGGGAGSSGGPGWPQAGSRAKGAGGLGGPWQGGELLRGPRGGPTHGADAHSRSDNPRQCFPSTWSTPCPLSPSSPTAILRQGALSPGARAGKVTRAPSAGTLSQESPALPAPRPPAPSVPRGWTQGRRAETGTSRPSRAHRGPWAGGRGASVELRWPGTRGRRTRTWHFFGKGGRAPWACPYLPGARPSSRPRAA